MGGKSQMQKNKNLIEIITKTGAIGVLAYIIVFFGSAYLTKITELQRQLLQIRIQLTKIQSSLLSKEDVESMIDNKFQIHEAKFHKQ